MIKVAMIGAGSVVFARNLTGDILGRPEFQDATIHYMDIDQDRLECAGLMGKKVAAKLGADKAVIKTTMDRREAVKDADFVINMVQIGGFNSTLVDFEIPRKYGLNFTIADTTGPGALFRALRTFPLLNGLVKDMEELCPRGVLLNYSNPMSMNMQTVFRTGNIQAVGLCHSVQGSLNGLMRCIDVDPNDVAFTCMGINHMAFYTKLEKDGQDLYPQLFEAIKDEGIFNRNKVRFELMKRFGYFVTESSEHNAEYCAHFIPHGKEQMSKFDVPIDEYLQRCDGIVDEFERIKAFARSDEPMGEIHRSHEYGSTIIHSMATGTPAVVYGNLPNNGAISNLPDNAIVETTTLVDRAGLQLCRVGELPPQLLGYVMPHVVQHELYIRAVLENRRDHIYQACMMDPLTAATVTPDKIVEMCDELIAGHGDLLPSLDPHRLVPTSGIDFHPPKPEELRASWDAAKAKSERDYIKEWKLIGPINGTKDEINLDTVPAVEKVLTNGVDISKPVEIDGQTFEWTKATAQRRGFVNLDKNIGRHEYSLAYAVHEWEEVHERETLLSCGSDDGIRIWIDGQEIIAKDTSRGYSEDSEQIEVKLKPGIHKMVVKIVNYEAGWGFGVKLPPANM